MVQPQFSIKLLVATNIFILVFISNVFSVFNLSGDKTFFSDSLRILRNLGGPISISVAFWTVFLIQNASGYYDDWVTVMIHVGMALRCTKHQFETLSMVRSQVCLKTGLSFAYD